jgi:hypothetical protein
VTGRSPSTAASCKLTLYLAGRLPYTQGYQHSSTLTHYAHYLHARITAFRTLKHDMVRVQAESNRASAYRTQTEGASGAFFQLRWIGRQAETASYPPWPPPTERARKLRSLTVEKGLLRETREVQRIIDTLVKCTVSRLLLHRSASHVADIRVLPLRTALIQFYRDDLHDECTVLAFRMLTKDLLVLFQAGNEGIINLLGPSGERRVNRRAIRLLTARLGGPPEHYFEMSHADASDALALYKAFCAQTKKVVEYLRFAKDLNNVIDVPIPNLKHAPVSLVAALEEYIQDPNFEQNREEYKNNVSSAGLLSFSSRRGADLPCVAPCRKTSRTARLRRRQPSLPLQPLKVCQSLVAMFCAPR